MNSSSTNTNAGADDDQDFASIDVDPHWIA
jgi:hypothetical protein